MKRVTASLLLAALTLPGPQLVGAANAADTPIRLVVNYANLDLSTAEGAKALYGRLRAAAEQVCAPLDRADLSLAWRYRACIQTALSNAVRDVDKPLLTQYYIERNGGVKDVSVALAK